MSGHGCNGGGVVAEWWEQVQLWKELAMQLTMLLVVAKLRMQQQPDEEGKASPLQCFHTITTRVAMCLVLVF